MTAANREAAEALVLAEVRQAREDGTGLTLGAPAVEVLDGLFAGLDELTVAYVLAACELAALRVDRDDLARRLAESEQHRRTLQTKIISARVGSK